GQKKFIRPEVSWVRETLAGWLHFFVFWGFTVLGLQIVTMFGRAYSEHFYVPLMSPSLLGGPYMFLRDCFEAIVLVCVLVLVARWAHNLYVLVMLNFLPLAKHFHVITSLPNVFFRKLEPLGALSKQDLENATTFGTSHVDQFTWKQVLDMFSCTECGRCSSQ